MTLDIRRILLTAALIAALGVSTVYLVVRLTKETIGYSQKCSGSYCWGYKLEQYRFLRRSTLTFWGSWGLLLQYELPPMKVERASEDRWLAVDRAIYLTFWLKPWQDTTASGDHVRLVYDFQRGDLNVVSALPLWRVSDFRSGNLGKNWLTNEEFERVLIRIEP